MRFRKPSSATASRDLQHRPGQPVHQPGIHAGAQDNQIAISMDGKGCWRDNVFVERLWKSVKYEEVYLKAYDSLSVAKASLGIYFNFYNTSRPHRSLDGQTPDTIYFADLPQNKAAAPSTALPTASSAYGPDRPPAAATVDNATRRAPLIAVEILSKQTGPPLHVRSQLIVAQVMCAKNNVLEYNF